MPKQKIVYNLRPLKKNERYATLDEAMKANKVAIFGSKKVDSRAQKYILGQKVKKVVVKSILFKWLNYEVS